MTERIDTQALLARIDLLDLIGRDVVLKKIANTRNGEYAGACLMCRTGRDRLRVWPALGPGRFWCRACGASGDAISYVMARDDVGFVQACEILGAAPARTSRPLLPSTPKRGGPPPAAWQRQGWAFIERADEVLWSARGRQALAYLHERGLDDETLKAWRIGLHPVKATAACGLWGLDEKVFKKVFMPKGIVLPWADGTLLHQIKVRDLDPKADPRYQSVTGGHPDLFGAWTMTGHDAVILCEGEFDTMLTWQAAMGEIGTATLGNSTTRPSSTRLSELRALRRVLLAYDNDAAGDKAVAELGALLPNAWRMPPTSGIDVTDFWRRGGSLEAWIDAWTHLMENLHRQRAAEA